MSVHHRAKLFAAALAVAFALTGCFSKGPGSAHTNNVHLVGAGATFPNPIYQKWVSDYQKLHPEVKIDYQSIGSGGGIKQIKEQTVDFGASDSPMTDEDLKSAPGTILHIPTVLGAVVITYNLPKASQPLRFSSEVIADIFLGKIKKWNDPKISADNPGVNLPSNDITVVHRADSSGTSFVFTDYLSKVSPEWKQKVGVGVQPSWPVGLGGKGNEGVTGQIKNTPNTIGYVELAYAVKNNLPVAEIKNGAGNFIKPSLESVTAAAAESVATTPPDLRVSITNASGANAYSISSYTYILLYKDEKDELKGKTVVDFLWWAIHDGQQVTKDPQYPYAPLPQEIVKRAEELLKTITSNGKVLHS